jgi:hypothetical protein
VKTTSDNISSLIQQGRARLKSINAGSTSRSSGTGLSGSGSALGFTATERERSPSPPTPTRTFNLGKAFGDVEGVPKTGAITSAKQLRKQKLVSSALAAVESKIATMSKEQRRAVMFNPFLGLSDFKAALTPAPNRSSSSSSSSNEGTGVLSRASGGPGSKDEIKAVLAAARANAVMDHSFAAPPEAPPLDDDLFTDHPTPSPFPSIPTGVPLTSPNAATATSSSGPPSAVLSPNDVTTPLDASSMRPRFNGRWLQAEDIGPINLKVKALFLVPRDVGTALLRQAKSQIGIWDGRSAIRLLTRACQQFELVYHAKPDDANNLTQWGEALSLQATLQSGLPVEASRIATLAATKFASATDISPRHLRAWRCWGRTCLHASQWCDQQQKIGWLKQAMITLQQAVTLMEGASTSGGSDDHHHHHHHHSNHHGRHHDAVSHVGAYNELGLTLLRIAHCHATRRTKGLVTWERRNAAFRPASSLSSSLTCDDETNLTRSSDQTTTTTLSSSSFDEKHSEPLVLNTSHSTDSSSSTSSSNKVLMSPTRGSEDDELTLYSNAERHLRQCITLHGGHFRGQLNYAMLLFRRAKHIRWSHSTLLPSLTSPMGIITAKGLLPPQPKVFDPVHVEEWQALLAAQFHELNKVCHELSTAERLLNASAASALLLANAISDDVDDFMMSPSSATTTTPTNTTPMPPFVRTVSLSTLESVTPMERSQSDPSSASSTPPPPSSSNASSVSDGLTPSSISTMVPSSPSLQPVALDRSLSDSDMLNDTCEQRRSSTIADDGVSLSLPLDALVSTPATGPAAIALLSSASSSIASLPSTIKLPTIVTSSSSSTSSTTSSSSSSMRLPGKPSFGGALTASPAVKRQHQQIIRRVADDPSAAVPFSRQQRIRSRYSHRPIFNCIH